MTNPDNLGNIAKILEFFVALIGFIVTIIGIIKAKNAAQRAERESVLARKEINRSYLLIDLGSVISKLNEIKRLHRIEQWELLPERYSSVRTIMISIMTSQKTLNTQQKSMLQGAIKQFGDFERAIEQANHGKIKFPNTAKLNSIVITQIDKINEIMCQLRQHEDGG